MMRTEQWNQIDCAPPPVSTSKVELSQLPNEYLQKTCRTVLQIVRHLKSPAGSGLFQTELYLVTRLYYRAACIFRRYRIKRTFRQLRNCLTRLKNLQMRKSFQDLLDILPKSSESSKEVYLPRKEMLQYLLIRLMGGARLLMQTCAYCHHGFEEVMLNLRLGMLEPQMLVFGACFARVWALCHAERKHYEEWYGALMEVGQHVPEAETEWLQTEIPEKLSDWLPPDPDLPDDVFAKLKAAQENQKSESSLKFDHEEDETESQDLETTDQIDISQVQDESMAEEALIDLDDLGSPVVRTETTNTDRGLGPQGDKIVSSDKEYAGDDSKNKQLKKKKKLQLKKKLLLKQQMNLQGTEENSQGAPEEMNDETNASSSKTKKTKGDKKKKKKIPEQILDSEEEMETEFQNDVDIQLLTKKNKTKAKKRKLAEMTGINDDKALKKLMKKGKLKRKISEIRRKQ